MAPIPHSPFPASLTSTNKKRRTSGFTSMEMIVVIALLVTALTVAVPLFLDVNKVNREQITLKKLTQLKQAIIGERHMVYQDNRTNFGFLGDTGVLPGDVSLGGDGFEDLFTNTNVTGADIYPSWQFDSSKGIAFGWRGPYLDNTMENGQYIALLDGWSRFFNYRDIDGNAATWDIEIRSAGPNGVFDYSPEVDDIFITISEDEARSYVAGTFRDITNTPIDESQVTVYYPAGTAGLSSIVITTDPVDQTHYDSQTDTVTPNNPKLPIGSRYFETLDLGLKKLGVIDGGASTLVNFVAQVVTPASPFWERTFYTTDKMNESGTDFQSPVTPLTGMGSWVLDTNSGTYYASGGQSEHRAVFGLPTWENYRVEVNATLYQGRGYGIFYRSDHEVNISGYCFQYDPGLNTWGGLTLVVRKFNNGAESSPFQQVNYFPWNFPDVYNASHHISITVQGTRHIIKVDGSEIFDFYDSDFLVGGPGLRSWDGQHYTDFHSLLVYDIPPLDTGEIVWWSFEEGDGSTVYGSGFNIDANEINGTLEDLNNVYRNWQADNIHGQAIYCDGSGDAHINFGNVLNFLPTDEFSISAWVRIDSYNAGNEYVVIAKNQNGNHRGWKLALTQYSSYGFGAEFTFQESRSGRNAERLIRHNTRVIDQNLWYHIMVTYQPTPIGNEIDTDSLKIYVTPHSSAVAQNTPNVVNVGIPGTNYSLLRLDSRTNNNQSMYIGCQYMGNDHFHGSIDEVRIYNRALTYNEVNDVFQKEK